MSAYVELSKQALHCNFSKSLFNYGAYDKVYIPRPVWFLIWPLLSA